LTIQQQRERLPVFKLRRELLYLVEKFQTLIVIGQTGCGKTTRMLESLYRFFFFFFWRVPINTHADIEIPQYLMEANWASNGKQIACTQVKIKNRNKKSALTE
jgi:ATP-dependent RNA helicase DDX35